MRVYNPEFEQHGWQSAAHGRRARHRRHAVPGRLDDDGARAAEGAGIHLLIHPVMRVRRDARRRAHRGPRPRTPRTRTARWPSRSSTSRSTARAGPSRARAHSASGCSTCSTRSRRPSRTGRAMRARAAELVAELREPPPCSTATSARRPRRCSPGWTTATSRSSAIAEYELATRDGERSPAARRRLRARHPARPPGQAPERVDAVRARATRSRPTATRSSSPRPTAGRRSTGPPTWTTSASSASTPTARSSASGASSGSTRRRPTARTSRDIPVVRRKVEAVARARRVPARQPRRTRRWWRSSTPTRATSCSRSPRTSCSSWPWASWPSASASACGCSSAATPTSASCPAWCSCRATASTPRNRERVQEILAEAFDAESVDFELRLSESVLVRIHFTRAGARRARCRTTTRGEIEARIVEATGSWSDELREALLAEAGEEHGTALYRRYGDAFRVGYRERGARPLGGRRHPPDRAAWRRTSSSPSALYHPLEAAAGSLRCKLYRRGEPVTLSEVLPMFESMGLRVRDERPLRGDAERRPADLDLRLRRRARGRRRARRRRRARALPGRVRRRLAGRARERRLQRARAAGRAWTGATSPCCARSRATCGRRAITFSERYMEQALIAHPRVAAALVELFRARFDPTADRSPKAADAIAAGIEEAIDAVDSLDEDRILRSFLAVVQAMLRTNHFLADPRPYLSFKLDPARVPLLPLPAPALRDLRVLAARRGRAPARRRGRPRRPALVGPPRGLPHGGPRADEGPDGQERADRARRRQGRLRRQAPAGRARGAGRRGRRLLPDVHQRPARPDRQRPRRDR